MSPSLGYVTYVLLTRSPLSAPKGFTFDLHALSTPLAFILSQDQTLRLISVSVFRQFRFLLVCSKKFLTKTHLGQAVIFLIILQLLTSFAFCGRESYLVTATVSRPIFHQNFNRFWRLKVPNFFVISAYFFVQFRLFVRRRILSQHSTCVKTNF